MHTIIRRFVGLGLIAMASTLTIAAPAWSDDRGRDGHGKDHDRGRDQDRRPGPGRGHDGRQTWQEHRAPTHRTADRAWEHDWNRRRAVERHHAAATWRFERGRGWRYFNAGVWSPFQVWWWIDGRPFLRPFPVASVVNYPTGRYELRGDGFAVPYRWVWVPTVVVAVPPPPPYPPAVGYPEPPPPYAYPPPPAG